MLLDICVRPQEDAPVRKVPSVAITLENGVDGDYALGGGHRQVTVLGRERWEAACAELGSRVPWTARRANLLVEGVDLMESVGAHLRVGKVVLEITGETEPCGIMDRAHAGLRQALVPEWRAGVTCRVLAAGTVRVGDPVSLERRGG